jgi:hypothetical protein
MIYTQQKNKWSRKDLDNLGNFKKKADPSVLLSVRIIHNWLMKNSTKLPFHLVQIQIRTSTDPLNEAGKR